MELGNDKRKLLTRPDFQKKIRFSRYLGKGVKNQGFSHFDENLDLDLVLFHLWDVKFKWYGSFGENRIFWKNPVPVLGAAKCQNWGKSALSKRSAWSATVKQIWIRFDFQAWQRLKFDIFAGFFHSPTPSPPTGGPQTGTKFGPETRYVIVLGNRSMDFFDFLHEVRG